MIEPVIGKEASREIVEPGKMNFAFRMIDGGKPRLLLRPQRAGRVYALRPHPHIPHRWRVVGHPNIYYATRAQAAQAAIMEEPR